MYMLIRKKNYLESFKVLKQTYSFRLYIKQKGELLKKVLSLINYFSKIKKE